MVFDLDLGTIRSTAQKHVATPGYVATAATLATVATKSAQSVAVVAVVATVASSHGLEITPKTPESVASVAAVATVATVASSHGVATHPQAPATDPGHARLLALVMTYCARTGASPQTRAQWVQDVEATAPEQRAELYQHLRACLPPAPRPAPAALPPTPPAPRVWLHLDAAWRHLDALYLAHHWTCTTCCTAGAGRGDRCDTGQRLHDQLAQAVRSA